VDSGVKESLLNLLFGLLVIPVLNKLLNYVANNLVKHCDHCNVNRGSFSLYFSRLISHCKSPAYHKKMQEYFNIDLENEFKLGDPQTVRHRRGEAGLLECYYQSSSPHPITIMSPPLLCSRVQVSQGKDGRFTKCILECEVTSNEWRFTQFLTDLKDSCQRQIVENGRKWFGWAFSPSIMSDSYISMFISSNKYKNDGCDRIRIRLGKELVERLNRQDAKEFRNQYLVFQLVYRGDLVEKGVFSQLWHADQVLKAKPMSGGTQEDESDEDMYDIDKLLERDSKKDVLRAKEKEKKAKRRKSKEKEDDRDQEDPEESEHDEKESGDETNNTGYGDAENTEDPEDVTTEVKRSSKSKKGKSKKAVSKPEEHSEDGDDDEREHVENVENVEEDRSKRGTPEDIEDDVAEMDERVRKKDRRKKDSGRSRSKKEVVIENVSQPEASEPAQASKSRKSREPKTSTKSKKNKSESRGGRVSERSKKDSSSKRKRRIILSNNRKRKW